MSKGWKMVNIEEVCEILDYKRVPVKEDKRIVGEYPYFGANGLQGYIDGYIFDEDLVLLAEDGGNFGSKEKPIAYKVTGKCWVNNHAHVLRPKNNILIDYLCYSLMFYDVSKLINGTTRAKLNQSAMKKMQIKYRHIETQRQIAAILDKASELIALRKKQLEELDALAESVFYDMFGDPVKNEKGWEVEPVINNCSCIVPGRDKPKSFTGNTPWITTAELCHLGYTYKSNAGLSDEEIQAVRAKVIPKGSVIITCVGDLGITSIAGNDMVINQQLHAFLCAKKLNNVFLAYNLSLRKDYMYKMASKTTVPYMNKSVCNSIPILLPPLSLQTRFATIIEKIEQQKTLVRQALQESEDLFQRLMQDLFRVES